MLTPEDQNKIRNITNNDSYSKFDAALQQVIKFFDLKKATPIGKGDIGAAYDIGDNKVLKITGSQIEVRSANYIRNLPSIPKHIITVFNVSKIEGTHYWALIIEKIKPLDESLHYDWSQVKYLLLSDADDEEIRELADEEVLNKDFIETLLKQRKGILKEYNQYKIWKLEAHAKNVGFDNEGNFIFFDFVVRKNINKKLNKPITEMKTIKINQLKKLIENLVDEAISENSPETKPAPRPVEAPPAPDKPKRRLPRRTLNPPKTAPKTRPKAEMKENTKAKYGDIINKITQKYLSLKKK